MWDEYLQQLVHFKGLMSCRFGIYLQTLTLKDSSKYGTFINNQRMTENTTRDLSTGDNVTFGVYNSQFKYAMRNKTRDCVQYVVI